LGRKPLRHLSLKAQALSNQHFPRPPNFDEATSMKFGY
jgi:hypothetical protein